MRKLLAASLLLAATALGQGGLPVTYERLLASRRSGTASSSR